MVPLCMTVLFDDPINFICVETTATSAHKIRKSDLIRLEAARSLSFYPACHCTSDLLAVKDTMQMAREIIFNTRVSLDRESSRCLFVDNRNRVYILH